MAPVHDLYWLYRSIPPEGIHAIYLRLHRAPSEALLRPIAITSHWQFAGWTWLMPMGSVHHSLIDFSLRHYQAPPQFLAILRTLYSELKAKIITHEWETPIISLQKGVYQGDPLLVVYNIQHGDEYVPS